MTELTHEPYDIRALAVDSTSVYWIESGSPYGPVYATIKKMPINGGAVTTLATLPDAQDYDSYIAVDSTNVYWLDSGYFWKVGINGGTGTKLNNGLLAMDSTSFYWTGHDPVTNYGTLYKMSKTGGAVTKLATGAQDYGQYVAVDSTSVYWFDRATQTLNKVGTGGGTVTQLTTGKVDGDHAIAVDSTSVYWLDYYGLEKVGINGGTVTMISSSNSYNVSDVKVDSTSVYLSRNGSIQKVSVNGGAITTLVWDAYPGNNWVVDTTSVYWVDYRSRGIIYKVPK